jgi:hypothetical protein
MLSTMACSIQKIINFNKKVSTSGKHKLIGAKVDILKVLFGIFWEYSRE